MSNKLKAITTKAKALYKSGKYKKWTDAIKAAAASLPGAKKKIGYSKLRLKTDKAITKEIKNEPKTLFPYTKKQNLVRAGKRYFDEQNRNIHKIGGYYAMFSKEGNKAVTDLIKYAKEKKLNRLQVQQKMKAIEKIHPEIFDTEPRDMIYEKLFKISGVKKTVKKKASPKKSAVRNYGSHKDTKSHNVKISVMSGANRFSLLVDKGINEFFVDKLKKLTEELAQAEKRKYLLEIEWKKSDKNFKERNLIFKKHWPKRIAMLKKMITDTKRQIK